MSVSSNAYELTGRTRQKARTRSALIAATRELLAEGVTPTVEQVADRAGVSRTTSYRYFPNQRTLLLATYPELEASSLLDHHAPEDPLARIDLAVGQVTDQLLAHEPELRAQWRLALDPANSHDLPLRTGRVIGWYEDALSPLRDRMSTAAVRRLALQVRATTGIEALAWLVDVGGLSRKDAIALMRASARTLVASAVER